MFRPLAIVFFFVSNQSITSINVEFSLNKFACLFFRPCPTRRRSVSTRWLRTIRSVTTPRCRTTCRPRARRREARSGSKSKIPMHQNVHCKFLFPSVVRTSACFSCLKEFTLCGSSLFFRSWLRTRARDKQAAMTLIRVIDFLN